MSDPVLVDIEDGTATITLNRPEARNALNPEMRTAFNEATERVEFDDAVRCVVLRGAGDHFMAGGDVKNMKTRMELEDSERRAMILNGIHDMHLAIYSLRRMPKPVIASVRGAAAGFGVGLLAACDLAIAADDSFYTLAYCHIGASPDGGSSYFLARTVGMKEAMEIALLGDRFDAETAKRYGLINWIVPAADLDAETAKLAGRLANGPTRAYANAKALFNASLNNTMETQLQMEAERMADSMLTADHAEGVAAFIDKRKPAFRGA